MSSHRAKNSRARSEYEPVTFRPSWAGLSLLCFALSLLANQLMEQQPWRPRNAWQWIYYRQVATFVVAALGLVFGLVGGWRRPSRGARFGALLNGSIVLLTGLLFIGWAVITRRY